MPKTLLLLLCLFFCFIRINAQQNYADSLKQELANAKEDTNKVQLLVDLSSIYGWSYPDSGILYPQQALQLAQKLNFARGEIGAYGTTLKRADAIVKGMLQHSRKSEGIKELTDINALADEYLRLSYHGLRAKAKDFNAEIKTYFDESLGKINIIPQDIGRVLLNLYNNAFYAVNEKKKMNIEGYEPTVSVSTKKSGSHVCISVSDNGNGISQNIVDKIFQPFFTTKPTGQGTGLGLSLSYDVIKAHGGDINVESMERAGTTFTIQLPIV